MSALFHAIVALFCIFGNGIVRVERYSNLWICHRCRVRDRHQSFRLILFSIYLYGLVRSYEGIRSFFPGFLSFCSFSQLLSLTILYKQLFFRKVSFAILFLTAFSHRETIIDRIPQKHSTPYFDFGRKMIHQLQIAPTT